MQLSTWPLHQFLPDVPALISCPDFLLLMDFCPGLVEQSIREHLWVHSDLLYSRCFYVTWYSCSHSFLVVRSFLGYESITSIYFILIWNSLAFGNMQQCLHWYFPTGLWMNKLYFILGCKATGPRKRIGDCRSCSPHLPESL